MKTLSAEQIYEASPEFEAAEIARQEAAAGDANPVRRSFRLKRVANRVQPPALVRTATTIRKKKGELDELQRQEQEQLAALARWETMLSDWQALHEEIGTAAIQLQQLNAHKAQLAAIIFDLKLAWGCAAAQSYSRWHGAAGLAELYNSIAGVERAIAGHPEWLKRQNEKISELKGQLLAFSKQHGIEEQLPAEILSK